MVQLNTPGGWWMPPSIFDATINRKPLNKNTVIGGILFGAGWAVSGACPGTVLAKIGEGKVLGLFAFIFKREEKTI